MLIYRCHSYSCMLFLLLLSALGEIDFNHVGFTEPPFSMMVTPGTRATFRCRHETANVIGWRINGTSIGQLGNPDFIPGTIRHSDGSLVHILTVVVHPEYNDTDIVCVAAFIRQELPLELSPIVTLTVFEGCNETCTYEGFVEVPQSVVAAVETEATFACRHISTDRISWLINGTILLDESCLPNITTWSDSLSDGDVIHSLNISDLATYNGTYVQCAAYVEVQPDRTIPALLLVQGPLRAISGVFRDNPVNHLGVSYFWEPPFTLNLTGVEPDIVYCVEVYNITCGEEILIASDCAVPNPIYPSSVGDGLGPGYVYEITVTPRSNVPGAVNGSSFTKREKFMNVEAFSTAVVESSPGVLIEFSVSVNDTVGFSESERLVKARARLYSIEIVSTDDPQTSVSAEVVGEGGDRVSVLLNKRKRWTYTVFAYGCQLHPVSITNMISTFAVQNVSVTSAAPGELEVTANFLANTSAIGMLAIVYSAESDSDIHYIEASLPHTEIHLTGLSGSAYFVSVFDIDHRGLPFDKAAILPMSANITGVSPVSASVAIYYTLQNISTGVCISCTFLDSSSTDCVAVVHQRISQLSSSGLMNIESSHKFTRSGDTAYGCIEGVNLTGSQIGVIGAQFQMETPIPTSFDIRDYIAALVVSWIILVFTMLIYFVSIFVCWRRAIKKKRKKQESERNVHEIALELTSLKHNSEFHLEEECSTKPEHTSVVDEVDRWESSRHKRTRDCDTSDKHLSIVDVDIIPEVETAVGYDGTTAMDVPPSISCEDRSSTTQPLSALRRNVPSAEPDTYFVSQSSLKPLGIQASNLLYDEEIHRCKCTYTKADFPGPVECDEVTKMRPTQVTDKRTPSSKEYMYLHLGSKEKHHRNLPKSASSDTYITKITTAKQEGGAYILGLADKSIDSESHDFGGNTISLQRNPSNIRYDPQSSTNEDSYPDELVTCKHPVISTASLPPSHCYSVIK